MLKHRRMIQLALAFAGGAGLFGIATAVEASIPDSNHVIHGCYKQTGSPSGTLRVIDTAKGQKCVPGELALNWNQTGLRGVTGLTGVRGPSGPQGPPPDTSLFYTKTESDERFAQGSATIAHGRVTMPQRPLSGNPGPPVDLFDVAGLGKVELVDCTPGGVGVQFTNTTGADVIISFNSQSHGYFVSPGQALTLSQTAGGWIWYFASTDPSGAAATFAVTANTGDPCYAQGQATISSAGS